MKPAFKLQLVTPDGVALPPFPGGGVFERNIETDIANAMVSAIPALVAGIVARGVGIARTEVHVAADIETALRTMLPELTATKVREALYGLKLETLKLV